MKCRLKRCDWDAYWLWKQGKTRPVNPLCFAHGVMVTKHYGGEKVRRG